MSLDRENQKSLNENETLEFFRKYFKKYYRVIAKQQVLSFPDNDYLNLEAPFNTIMKTMEDWCNKNKGKKNMKGLVTLGYNLDKHLEFLNFPNDIFQSISMDLEEILITFNPMKKIILIIRIAKDTNLRYEMELSTADLLKFTLLYKDVLNNSRVTLLNLLVVNKESDLRSLKCKFCNDQIISVETLKTTKSFEKWLKDKCFIDTDTYMEKVNKSFTTDFYAKLLGFLASYQFTKEKSRYGELPSLSTNPVKQMAPTLLMTPEQKKVVYSSRKHLIIKGCYGSGKTIVACKKAEIISRSLKKDDSLYYIICDSRSVLRAEIKPVPKMELISNTDQIKESILLDQILKDNPKKGKLNIIFDEFDGENLDENEAKALNQHFRMNERLKNSNVILIHQPLKVERMVNGTTIKGNMFEMLETMNPPLELTHNMRNSMEINRLVKATTDALKDHKTVYFDTASNAMAQKKNAVDGVDQTNFLVVKSERRKRKFSKTKPGKHEIETSLKNDDAVLRKKFKADEAYEHSISANSQSKSTNTVTSRFQHIKSNKSGHKIKSTLPSFYEIDYPEASTNFKVCLIAILHNILGAKVEDNQLDVSSLNGLTDMQDFQKHVILHFNALHAIPKTFDDVFKLMGISEKVTNNYDDFKRDSDKAIFIGTYRTFRGLEYPRMIIVLNTSLRFLKHFLPECLNRCTTFLHIILLNKQGQVENCDQTETLLGVIEKWKTPSRGRALVKQWKTKLSGLERNSCKTSQRVSPETSEIRIRTKPLVYAELDKYIEQLDLKTTENLDQTAYDMKEIEHTKMR